MRRVQVTASASGGGSTSTAKGDSLAATVSTSPSGSSSGGGDCSDTPPSSTYTCQQQVRWLLGPTLPDPLSPICRCCREDNLLLEH